MQSANEPKKSLLVAAAALALAAVILACPLGMMAHSQMTQMMGQNMGTHGLEGMCPLFCGLPSYSVGFESNVFVLGPLPVHLAPSPASTTWPIFHPPTLA